MRSEGRRRTRNRPRESPSLARPTLQRHRVPMTTQIISQQRRRRPPGDKEATAPASTTVKCLVSGHKASGVTVTAVVRPIRTVSQCQQLATATERAPRCRSSFSRLWSKRATEAQVPLPQTGHRSVPISKHVSQSRHSAVRPNGKWRVLTVCRVLSSLTPLRRSGRLVGCSRETPRGWQPAGIRRPVSTSTFGTPCDPDPHRAGTRCGKGTYEGAVAVAPQLRWCLPGS